ncbi:hypothetical protein CC2G_004652 [Coprinopsis cinerea AmutBmut pab1-1]|nr:hypothetical protein CC2G_004652 [Coprinopsis cinerea AmutBmut pab1-1]
MQGEALDRLDPSSKRLPYHRLDSFTVAAVLTRTNAGYQHLSWFLFVFSLTRTGKADDGLLLLGRIIISFIIITFYCISSRMCSLSRDLPVLYKGTFNVKG